MVDFPQSVKENPIINSTRQSPPPPPKKKKKKKNTKKNRDVVSSCIVKALHLQKLLTFFSTKIPVNTILYLLEKLTF